MFVLVLQLCLTVKVSNERTSRFLYLKVYTTKMSLSGISFKSPNADREKCFGTENAKWLAMSSLKKGLFKGSKLREIEALKEGST